MGAVLESGAPPVDRLMVLRRPSGTTAAFSGNWSRAWHSLSLVDSQADIARKQQQADHVESLR
jgi:hypothetical protein